MTVLVLGRDSTGVVAESDGFKYYLTDCCGASAKGCDGYVGCRACYAPVDEALGGCPGLGRDWEPVPLNLTEVYGDGLPYDQWKSTTTRKA